MNECDRHVFKFMIIEAAPCLLMRGLAVHRPLRRAPRFPRSSRSSNLLPIFCLTLDTGRSPGSKLSLSFMSVSGWRRDYTPVDEGLSDASNSDSDSAAHPLNPSRPAPRLSSYAEYANKLPPLVRRPPEDLRVVRYNPFSLFLIRLCPTIAVVVWGATLLGLLGAWYWIDGREQYKW